jgi:hypothetical protein
MKIIPAKITCAQLQTPAGVTPRATVLAPGS